MTIVVETGTGSSTADSYISVADADTYHSNLSNSAWASADDADKEVALRKATQYLDATYKWIGTIYSTTQSLGWPRVSVTDKEGRDLDYSVPLNIKNATCELALIALSSSLVVNTDSSSYIKREKVGPIETEYKDGAPSQTQYNYVSRLLKGLHIGSSSSNTVSVVRA